MNVQRKRIGCKLSPGTTAELSWMRGQEMGKRRGGGEDNTLMGKTVRWR